MLESSKLTKKLLHYCLLPTSGSLSFVWKKKKKKKGRHWKKRKRKKNRKRDEKGKGILNPFFLIPFLEIAIGDIAKIDEVTEDYGTPFSLFFHLPLHLILAISASLHSLFLFSFLNSFRAFFLFLLSFFEFGI